MVRAGHVCGTSGSGIVSSAADVQWMSVVRGMRVDRVCEMCMFGSGGVDGEEGEWMRGLGLGFTNPAGTGEECVWVAVEWVV